MDRILRTLLYILLFATLLPVAALAETCFLIDVDSLDMQSLNDDAYVQNHLSGQTQGVRIRKYISDSNELAARVRLTITQAETSTIVYDKNYGYVSGTFDSGDIYLPYVDNNTIPYLITLSVEDWTFAMPFMQLRARLSQNTGSTYGLRLRDANPALTDSWIMGTMLDLQQLSQSGGTVLPVCASNQYIVGYAMVWVENEQLTVSLTFLPEANVTLNHCAVYLIKDVGTLTTVEAAIMNQRAYGLDQPIDISGMRTALLYLPMTLSYDPSILEVYTYDPNSNDVSAQWLLWQENLSGERAGNAWDDELATETPCLDALSPVDTPMQTALPQEVQPEEILPEMFPPEYFQTDEPMIQFDQQAEEIMESILP